MLTVREICNYFLGSEEIVVSMDGRNYDLQKAGGSAIDPIMMAFFGDYIVEDIAACGENCFAIDIKMEPMKAEAQK